MFFEASITVSSPYELKSSDRLKIYQINNIVLDNKSQGGKRSQVYVEWKGEKFLLCNLKKGERDCYPCTFMFKVDVKKKGYKFTIEGDDKAKVSMIGFVEYEEEEEEKKEEEKEQKKVIKDKKIMNEDNKDNDNQPDDEKMKAVRKITRLVRRILNHKSN